MDRSQIIGRGRLKDAGVARRVSRSEYGGSRVGAPRPHPLARGRTRLRGGTGGDSAALYLRGERHTRPVPSHGENIWRHARRVLQDSAGPSGWRAEPCSLPAKAVGGWWSPGADLTSGGAYRSALEHSSRLTARTLDGRSCLLHQKPRKRPARPSPPAGAGAPASGGAPRPLLARATDSLPIPISPRSRPVCRRPKEGKRKDFRSHSAAEFILTERSDHTRVLHHGQRNVSRRL